MKAIAASRIAQNRITSRARSERVRRSRMGSASGVAEAVADAPHREQVLGLLGVALELLAQVTDVDVDRARVAERGVAPDLGEQHVARVDAAGVPRDGGEDLELHERRLDPLA